MHLLQSPLEPVQLTLRQASFRAAGRARSVERDEPHGRRVVNVVRSSVLPIVLREPVAIRLRAGSKMRVHELTKEYIEEYYPFVTSEE